MAMVSGSVDHAPMNGSVSAVALEHGVSEADRLRAFGASINRSLH
jgi:hypothetical protein